MNFTKPLLSWYRKNKRDLPWRHTKDPYKVWISEIILQQTRIEQGRPYYEKFVAACPTIERLASTDEQEVLKLWQGLGYYSRARNMLATARMIMKDYDGKFPGTYPAIRSLRGVGDYTAAAIASISFDLPYAVMDGNVMRFISRFFGIAESIDLPGTKKKLLEIATGNIDRRNPGDYNQAMMEFGAIVCTPSKPDCGHCIFKKSCVAFSRIMVDHIPARNPKAVIRSRYLHYLVLTVTHQGTEYVYLNKRTGNDIWKNLYDFPCLEKPVKIKDHHLNYSEFDSLVPPGKFKFLGTSGKYTHLLTHQKLHAIFYRFHSEKIADLPYILVSRKDIHNYPVPKLIDRYLSDMIL